MYDLGIWRATLNVAPSNRARGLDISAGWSPSPSAQLCVFVNSATTDA